jgi:large conductance mechanosensitive channel
MLNEFKKFALRGNVLDLAVGVIIGGAFGKIVTSLVNDILMPLIGAMLGGVNFGHLKIIIKKAVGEVPEVSLNYGMFIQSVFDFLIIALSIFVFIKIINNFLKKNEPSNQVPVEVVKTDEQKVLEEIRDILKQK